MTPETFGDRLRKAREAEGLGTNELGRVVGTGGSTISRWESGDRSPDRLDRELARRAALALKVRLDWLLTGEGPMRDEPVSNDPLPRRAEAARLARDAGVFEAAVRSVLEEVPEAGASERPVLWWANRMQVRQLELMPNTGQLAVTPRRVPEPKSSAPASATRPTLPPTDEQPPEATTAAEPNAERRKSPTPRRRTS